MLTCDFCGSTTNDRNDLQIIEFLCFTDPALVNQSPLWAGCADCSALIAADSWDALVVRVQRAHAMRGAVSIATAAAYDALRRNKVGGPRPHRNSDYEGWD